MEFNARVNIELLETALVSGNNLDVALDAAIDEIRRLNAVIAGNTEFLKKIGSSLDRLTADAADIVDGLRGDEYDLSAAAKYELEYDGF